MNANEENKLQDIAREIQALTSQLHTAGRYDLLLKAIGVPMLEQLRTEAAKASLSPLIIDRRYNFILKKQNIEIELNPVHKAVYLLFLNHPEGIEFRNLPDHRQELLEIYANISQRMDMSSIIDTVDRLVNPLDNAINEKCSRIKAAFTSILDPYAASYYVISSRSIRHINTSSRIWYERIKTITLPRHLVIREYEG